MGKIKKIESFWSLGRGIKKRYIEKKNDFI